MAMETLYITHIPQSLEWVTYRAPLTSPHVIQVAGIGYKGIGVCVGPIYTYIPQFLDWLTYWSRFEGLVAIHGYVPLYEEGQRDDLGQGRPYRRPVLFMHHLLSWTTYRPFPRAEYHGQRLIYNDCIYRCVILPPHPKLYIW